MNCSMPGFPVFHYLPVCSDSSPLSQWCHQTISSSVVPFSSCPQSFLAIRVFSNALALCIRWPKYWSCSFSISPSSKYSRLISFMIEWFDLLAVQGTLRVFSSINLVAYKIASYYLIDLSGQKSVMAQLGLPFRVPHSSINGCVLSLFKGWLSSGLFHP